MTVYKRYAYKNDCGIEIYDTANRFNEPVDCVAFKRHEYFVDGRHEMPNPHCLWASRKVLATTDKLVAEGKLAYTGRTTDFYGVKHYEVMPDLDWWESLSVVNYDF